MQNGLEQVQAYSALMGNQFRPELERICRRAVADYPNVDPARLRRFLETAEDPEWCSERVARHIARRMYEGLIREGEL